MKLSRYAPSAQFLVIAGSLFISAGLVYAAQLITHPSASTASLQTDQTDTQASDASNWQAALYAEQAANASTSLAAPDPNVVNQFLAAAKSNNVTDTVARTMLINLTNAKAQGLGDDVPTQDQIVSTAISQVAAATAAPKTYTTADLTVVANSPSSLRAFGNGVMQALGAHQTASEQATLLAVDGIIEGGDSSKAATLRNIGAAYAGAATDLLKVPVPQTLAPLYLQAVNNLAATASTFSSISTVGTDAVQGLAGLQAYENLLDSNARVFTNIAVELNKDGILFTKDEPGSAWSALLSASTGS
jgi:hypothetical protein